MSSLMDEASILNFLVSRSQTAVLKDGREPIILTFPCVLSRAFIDDQSIVRALNSGACSPTLTSSPIIVTFWPRNSINPFLSILTLHLQAKTISSLRNNNKSAQDFLQSFKERKLHFNRLAEEIEIHSLYPHPGAPGGIRTHNLRFRRPLLCPLSYGGISIFFQHSGHGRSPL